MTDQHAAAGGEVGARIDRFLADYLGAEHSATVVPLSGDASDRRYVRVLRPGHHSQVLAIYPGPIAYAALPFVNVAHLLQAMPVPAPRLLGHSDALGIIALEDLGDRTLYAHLATAEPAERTRLYRQAVTLIHDLQRRGRELASPAYVPYGLAFDVEKLGWEMDFFVTHFVGGHRGSALPEARRDALRRAFAPMVEELAGEPRVLCHRDYHSRNLMLREGRLYLIDFQDARMGPDTYDLASLLRDSYVDFDEAEVDSLIDLFLTLGGEGAAAERAEFRRRFDLMALQRNIKALGTFGFQASARGNSSYLQYVPRTMSYVRATLSRYQRFAHLRAQLAAHLPELR